MAKKVLALLSVLFLLASCAAQRTVFFSDPPGAQIAINGEVIGKTPCEYEYRAGAGKVFEIAIHKKLYQPVEGKIETDAVDKGSRDKWLVAGLVWSPLWLGTLFTKKLQDSYHFILTKIEQAGENPADQDVPLQILSRKEENASSLPAGIPPSS